MRITIKKARIAFCQNLFKAGVVNAGDTPKFSSCFILEKDDPQIKMINEAIVKTAKEKWKEDADKILKAAKNKDYLCLHDGDDKAQYEGFEGNVYISASSYKKPVVRNTDGTPLSEEQGVLYAGCYVHAIVDVWAMDNKYGKKINAELKAVVYHSEGDAFCGSAPVSEDELEDLTVSDDNDMPCDADDDIL